MSANPFKGNINYFPKKNKKQNNKLISFDVTSDATCEFTDILLCEFRGFHLSKDEKLSLTHKDRETIKCYQHIDLKTIKALSEQLIKQICKNPNSEICILAEEFGVYICLAAAFSGRLPTDKEIIFHLKNTPLAIFPKRLIKTSPAKKHSLEFEVSDDSWLRPFKSLYENIPGDKKATQVLKTAV